MTLHRIAASIAVLWLGTLGLAYANWTASGTFRYIDREFDQTGFTGAEPPLPARYVTVEVRDFNGKGGNAVLATGTTDANGAFSIAVSDNKTRTVYVRALTSASGAGGLYLKVQNRVTPKNPYAVASANVPGHAPSTNVNFGTLTAAIGAGGEAFNLFDTGVRSIDFIASVNGSRPGSGNLLTLEWQAATGDGTYYFDPTSQTDFLRDISNYKETVVDHENGHYDYLLYSGSDTPGGTHHLLDCAQDIRVAYDEGRATWFGQSVRRFHNLPHP